MWTRNSPLAADHAAAGSFESAMQVGRRRYRLLLVVGPLTPLSCSTDKSPRSISPLSNPSSSKHTHPPTSTSPPTLPSHHSSSTSAATPRRPSCARCSPCRR
jgi:hypothetical protein